MSIKRYVNGSWRSIGFIRQYKNSSWKDIVDGYKYREQNFIPIQSKNQKSFYADKGNGYTNITLPYIEIAASACNFTIDTLVCYNDPSDALSVSATFISDPEKQEFIIYHVGPSTLFIIMQYDYTGLPNNPFLNLATDKIQIPVTRLNQSYKLFVAGHKSAL